MSEKVKKYLEWAKNHYSSLAELMDKEKKEKYRIQHEGKVKFINLLLLKIEVGDFDD
jgi:hypothetical protein